MYNNESNEYYENYIRSILGYPYYNNIEENKDEQYQINYRNIQETEELENCYPDIYKIIYPQIIEVCSENTEPISANLVDELINKVYERIENNGTINININLDSKNQNLREIENRKNNSNHKREVRNQENRGEDRHFRNKWIQDLIRILLIRELLEKPIKRTPIGRPPFYGRPDNKPGHRSPFMPRNLYEY